MTKWDDYVLAFILVVLFTVVPVILYILPSIIADKRQNSGSIKRLNLWLGWTGIGWIVALIWALRSPKRQPRKLVGSEVQPSSSTPIARPDRFGFPRYLLREKLKLVGKTFYVYGPDGEETLFAEMKAFKLREDIRLYAGENHQEEVLRIKAREILDVSATYDVVDSATDAAIGAARRQGLRSLLRDEWTILDVQGQPVVVIKEDSLLLALSRRFLFGFLPQRYTGIMHGRVVCEFRQSWNPFVMNMSADFSQDINRSLDRRLGIASVILLCAIEGKQR